MPLQQQQQQLADAAGAAQMHDCLARLHEAVLLLQRENQQLVARVQQLQQQQQQMRMQALHHLQACAKNGGAASRAQSLSPFGKASELSASAERCRSGGLTAALGRVLSGSALPLPEETPDGIRSAPNPSTPLLRGGDISVEGFLST